jgi:hypothetical protein
LSVSPPAGTQLVVDGTPIHAQPAASAAIKLARAADGAWQTVNAFPAIRKHPGISGPIDDAFYSPFLIVTPTGKSSNPAVAKWVACEMAHSIDRWTALMRGAPRVRRDVDVTAEDVQKYHLILWGDPESNQWIARALAKPAAPITWTKQEVRLGDDRWDAQRHVPVLIMPNAEASDRYIVFNSGLTFREKHDRTNSLQNPQLPDWAVVSLDEAPSADSPGAIMAAGFFSDQWKLDPEMTYKN